MSIELGGGGSLPNGTSNPIIIPNSEAPENVLMVDSKIQLLQNQQSGDQVYDPYKILTSGADTNPGYLSDKINSSQFSIVDNLLRLSSFDTLTTTLLTEGTNLYYTQARFDSALAVKTTANLTEGSNLYYTEARVSANTNVAANTAKIGITTGQASAIAANTAKVGYTEALVSANSSVVANTAKTGITAQQTADIVANKAASHTHANLVLLSSYTQTEANIADAVTKKHSHANLSVLNGTEESFTTALKLQYDTLVASNITSVVSPLDLTTGVLSHSSTDGNKHVTSNSGKAQYSILTSGASAGVYTWETINTIISNITIFEATPSTSTVLGVQSAYVNTHVGNGTSNVKHVTDANLTYINTTIPAHIASTVLHLPTITPTTDQGKFLWVNTSDQPEWTSSSTAVILAGETYITGSGTNTLTLAKVTLAQTELIAGSNITFSTNTISATQRTISGSSISGNATTCISAGWAYTHEQITGSGGHIPSGGTSTQYIAGDGTVKDFSAAPGATYQILLNPGATGSVSDRLGSTPTFPSGWSGAVGAVTTDLLITHTAAAEIADITIFADDGTDVTKLIGSAAYSTIIGNQGNTTISIASLSTITEKIRIYLRFL